MTAPVQVSTRRAIFEELRQELEKHADLKLGVAASREFQKIINATVGNYVLTVKKQYGEDIWQDEEVRRFALTITRRISSAAKKRGGKSPSAAAIRDAANEQIRRAHDRFCKSLPPTAPSRGVRARPKGPMCDMYLKSLDDGA